MLTFVRTVAYQIAHEAARDRRLERPQLSDRHAVKFARRLGRRQEPYVCGTCPPVHGTPSDPRIKSTTTTVWSRSADTDSEWSRITSARYAARLGGDQDPTSGSSHASCLWGPVRQ